MEVGCGPRAGFCARMDMSKLSEEWRGRECPEVAENGGEILQTLLRQ